MHIAPNERAKLELNTIFECSARNIKCEFIDIPLGTFTMGSNSGLPIEQPTHEVSISSPIAALSTLVTQELYSAISGSNPSHHKGKYNPVENVNWFEAQGFCKALSSLLQLPIRLPKEAEWEYFCRCNSQTEYCFGDSVREVRNHAWFDMNSLGTTHSVGKKKANQWGLYDTMGNVWEWCEDQYRSSYSPEDAVSQKRVIRGGAYDMDEFRLRSAYRSSEYPEVRLKKIGFRVIIDYNAPNH